MSFRHWLIWASFPSGAAPASHSSTNLRPPCNWTCGTTRADRLFPFTSLSGVRQFEAVWWGTFIILIDCVIIQRIREWFVSPITEFSVGVWRNTFGLRETYHWSVNNKTYPKICYTEINITIGWIWGIYQMKTIHRFRKNSSIYVCPYCAGNCGHCLDMPNHCPGNITLTQ